MAKIQGISQAFSKRQSALGIEIREGNWSLMLRVPNLQADSIREEFKAGNWCQELASRALTIALTSNTTRDWISWIDVCHATRGVSNHDLLQLQENCSAWQVQTNGLRWRLENYTRALRPDGQRFIEARFTDDLIKKLCQDRSSVNRLGQKLGLKPLGAQAADYPMLLANLASLTDEDLCTQVRECSDYNQWLIKTAASITNRMQSFENTISKLLGNRTSGGGVCSIAVVGNAPTILNSKQGSEIDECDLVIRFNNASVESSNMTHKGMRTDIWVMSPSTPLSYCPADAQTVIVSGVRPLLRPSRYWPTLDQAPDLSECPDEVWYSLVDQLKAPPSAGLLILSSLKSLNLNLNIKRFGFTEFQGVHGLHKNHHADAAPVSGRHNWSREVQWMQDNY
ncbi:MAG: glycosyltransferase family 29 protein [Granulosicoccus sp.]